MVVFALCSALKGTSRIRFVTLYDWLNRTVSSEVGELPLLLCFILVFISLAITAKKLITFCRSIVIEHLHVLIFDENLVLVLAHLLGCLADNKGLFSKRALEVRLVCLDLHTLAHQTGICIFAHKILSVIVTTVIN